MKVARDCSSSFFAILPGSVLLAMLSSSTASPFMLLFSLHIGSMTLGANESNRL